MADAVEEAAGRLYGLPLEEFTRERDATARALRKEKQRDAAAAVGKLPKPSQAAWAANHLARERRDLVDAVLESGSALRDAQEAAMAGGGAKPLREATANERTAVEAVVEAASELRPVGRPPSETTLERLRTTLHAATADDDVRAALDAGRLVEDATGGSAWGLLAAPVGDEEPAPAAKQRAPAKRGKPAAKRRAPTTDKDREAAERERREREEAAREEREQRRRLEAELREARTELRARERELGRAEREADRAARRLDDALAAADEARTAVEEAHAEVETARDAATSARDDVARLEEHLD